MRKLLIFAVLIVVLIYPANAMSLAPPEVPDSGAELMPDEYDSFGEALWYVFRVAMNQLQPSFADACGICFSLIGIILLVAIVKNFSGGMDGIVQLCAAVVIGCLLIRPSGAFVDLCRNTIQQLSDYGKLLLPVMAAALAAQGGTTAAAAVYAGTLIFDTLLVGLITHILIPGVYIYIALCIASAAMENEGLIELKKLVKWSATWLLKIILYVFTGYIAITGIVSGTADAAAIRAAKLAISGVVPVVGNILSDASEAILVGAGVMKSAVGIYGLLAIVSVSIGPFLQIGVQYLLLKATAAICGMIGIKQSTELIREYSGAVGLMLAMTGTVCLLLMISVVCFMKGVL